MVRIDVCREVIVKIGQNGKRIPCVRFFLIFSAPVSEMISPAGKIDKVAILAI